MFVNEPLPFRHILRLTNTQTIFPADLFHIYPNLAQENY